MLKNIGYLLAGIFFGFTLSRVGASDYDFIHRMFTGENLHLPLVIGSAILIAYLGMRFLDAMGGRDVNGWNIEINRKPLNIYTVIGGILFGIGWAVAGACPGTILAQIGEGKLLGLFTFLGMLFGTYLYARLAENNPNLG